MTPLSRQPPPAASHLFYERLAPDPTLCQKKPRLAGHASTVVTEKVSRKKLRPVLTRGAEAMDIVFRTEADNEPINRQLGRQVADSGVSSRSDDAEERR
jgi:hypothetical protein